MGIFGDTDDQIWLVRGLLEVSISGQYENCSYASFPHPKYIKPLIGIVSLV